MKMIVLTIATCLLCISLIQAQDENVIAYGETARGEITLNEFESLYSFEGVAGDLIRAELSRRMTYPLTGPSGTNRRWFCSIRT